MENRFFASAYRTGIDTGFPQTPLNLALDGVDDLRRFATGAAFDRFPSTRERG